MANFPLSDINTVILISPKNQKTLFDSNSTVMIHTEKSKTCTISP